MTDTQAIQPITIDTISDVMCPWCFIGKRRLERAIAQLPEIDIEVNWRPFQLDPTLPPEGKDRQAYLEEKFGGPEEAEQVYDQIREAGEAEGIPFAFEKIARSPNTIDAHRVIRWAGIEGVQTPLVERLFSLYFLEGADIGAHETLIQAAREAGMDPAVVEQLLSSDADRGAVEEEISVAQQIGVTGVPCFIVDNRYAVLGAQDASVIADAIRQSYQERQAGVRPPTEGGPEGSGTA
ncbi:DsbA family oxidoreductase [Amorphus orientalis]|uniref:DsbA family dithiol-disulfide isomerase n=1 Tax=Amorphus orientalis TaxID=649198 RepID=A0AAE3VP59_9HYPH|nr:DsbA family oxidoreductase [Amorphus orientalis]MDQ0315668.1 putative DsbA family dithiol-disulfide isomerase [Amorphus orientalis]